MTSIRNLAASALVVLCSGLTIVACSSSHRSSPPPPPAPAGALVGVVADSLGQPVSGAEVDLSGNGILHGSTDSLGNYKIGNVPAGLWTLGVYASAYPRAQGAFYNYDNSVSIASTNSTTYDIVIPYPCNVPPSADTSTTTTGDPGDPQIDLESESGAAPSIVALRFSFNPQVTPAAHISRAVIRLTASALGGTGTLSASAYRIPSTITWTESDMSTISFNTFRSATPDSPSSTVVNSGVYEFDVTQLVRGWIAGTITNDGVAIVSYDSQTTHMYCDARGSQNWISGPGTPPVLVLTP